MFNLLEKFVPPIEWPTQWSLAASKPERNNSISDLAAHFDMIDDRMTET